MNYSIIGSGQIGSAVARQFVRSGIKVAITNTRGPESLAALGKELGHSVVAQTFEGAHFRKSPKGQCRSGESGRETRVRSGHAREARRRPTGCWVADAIGGQTTAIWAPTCRTLSPIWLFLQPLSAGLAV